MIKGELATKDWRWARRSGTQGLEVAKVKPDTITGTDNAVESCPDELHIVTEHN